MSEQEKNNWVPEDWTQPSGETPEPAVDPQKIKSESAWMPSDSSTAVLPDAPNVPNTSIPPASISTSGIATASVPTRGIPAVDSPTEGMPIVDAPGRGIPTAGAATDTVPPPGAGIFRDEAPAPTPMSTEEARLAAERSARKEARLQALANGPVSPEPVVTPEPVKPKPSNDKFFPSLGLFLLRIVVAGIMGIHGVQWLADINRAVGSLANTIIPLEWHGLIILVVGITSLVIAFSLVLGLLARVAGFLLAAIAGCTLAFVEWGPYSIFQDQVWPGVLGEQQLLLAVVGVLIMFVGAGGWSLDRGFRVHRANARLASDA